LKKWSRSHVKVIARLGYNNIAPSSRISTLTHVNGKFLPTGEMIKFWEGSLYSLIANHHDGEFIAPDVVKIRFAKPTLDELIRALKDVVRRQKMAEYEMRDIGHTEFSPQRARPDRRIVGFAPWVWIQR
jgi:hypothetical protein